MKKMIVISVMIMLLLAVSVLALTVRIGDKTGTIQPPKTLDTSKIVTTATMNNYQASVSTLQANNNILQDKIFLTDFKYDFLMSEFTKLKNENLMLKQELCKVNNKYTFCIGMIG